MMLLQQRAKMTRFHPRTSILSTRPRDPITSRRTKYLNISFRVDIDFIFQADESSNLSTTYVNPESL
jgi:hypothetical protein